MPSQHRDPDPLHFQINFTFGKGDSWSPFPDIMKHLHCCDEKDLNKQQLEGVRINDTFNYFLFFELAVDM